jgi:chromosome segregation ATPase
VQDKLNEDLRTQLADQRAQNEQLTASVAQLEANLDDMKEQNDRFKSENDTFHSNNQELKGTVDQLAANAEAERKEFEKMQARAQEAYNVAARSFQQLDTGNERLQGLLGEMDDTNEQSKEHMNSLLEVLSGLAETKEELKMITEQNRALAQKNEELSHRLMDIVKRMENIDMANKMQLLITRVDAVGDGGVRDTLKEGNPLNPKQRQELYELLEQIDEQMDAFQQMDQIKALAQVQS